MMNKAAVYVRLLRGFVASAKLHDMFWSSYQETCIIIIIIIIITVIISITTTTNTTSIIIIIIIIIIVNIIIGSLPDSPQNAHRRSVASDTGINIHRVV